MEEESPDLMDGFEEYVAHNDMFEEMDQDDIENWMEDDD